MNLELTLPDCEETLPGPSTWSRHQSKKQPSDEIREALERKSTSAEPRNDSHDPLPSGTNIQVIPGTPLTELESAARNHSKH